MAKQSSFGVRLKHAWNAFLNRAPTEEYKVYNTIANSYGYRPDKLPMPSGVERSIINSVYNRISLDVAATNIMHVRTNEQNQYLETMDSGLNNCLTMEANIDQTGRAFIQDLVLTMLDEGCVAVVPVDTDDDPKITASYDILTMRVGKIVTWYPRHVKVSVYNDHEDKGKREEIILPKEDVAIIENPFYSVMNERNSILQRLIRKFALLDAIDEHNGSSKLDLLIQLPYTIKSSTRQEQADKRLKDIEAQLAASKFGIAYIDGTEHVTQLNRPVENNMLAQVQYLVELLFSQLGMSQAILNGTASQEEQTTYRDHIIEPVLSAITNEYTRKFISKTARTQHQRVMFFSDPFRLIPAAQLAELSDKLTRNEIVTSNEIRQAIGLMPSKDPKADQLINSNIKQSNDEAPPKETNKEEGDSNQNEK